VKKWRTLQHTIVLSALAYLCPHLAPKSGNNEKQRIGIKQPSNEPNV